MQYKLDSDCTGILINDGATQGYGAANLPAETHRFRMAGFATDNLYSAFTDPLSAAFGSQRRGG